MSAGSLPSSNVIVYRIVLPGAAAPVQLANQSAVRSDSVMLAQTSSIGARNVRVSTRSRPSGVRIRLPVGVVVMRCSPCRSRPMLGSRALSKAFSRITSAPESGDDNVEHPPPPDGGGHARGRACQSTRVVLRSRLRTGHHTVHGVD